MTNPWIWLYFINNHRHQAYDHDGSTNVEYTKGYHDGWEAGEQSTEKYKESESTEKQSQDYRDGYNDAQKNNSK